MQTIALAREVETAFLHHQAGRFHEAETIYRQVLSVDPTCVDALHLLGMLLHQLGSYEDAFDLLSKAVTIDATDPFLQNNLGSSLRKLGRFDEAEAAFRRATILKPDFAGAFDNLGFTLVDCDKRSEAEVAFRQSLNIEPGSPETLCALGNVLIGLGRPDETVMFYRQALVAKPEYAEAYCNLGNALLDLDQADEAESAFRQALAIKPDFAETYNNLANLLIKLGRFDEAEQSCRNALTIRPDYAVALDNLGTALVELGRVNEAEQAYRQALTCRPDYAKALCDLGSLLNNLGRHDEAKSACLQALTIEPGNALVYNNLGHALFELGCLEDAEAAFREALSNNPLLCEVYANLCNVLKELGRLNEAQEACLRALAINPELHDCRIKLAMLSLPLVVHTKAQASAVPDEFSRSLLELEKTTGENKFADLGKEIGAAQPFYLAYRSGNHNALLSLYGDIICKARKAWLEQQYAIPLSRPPRRKRLRLVIVTGQARRHSVWYVLLYGILRHIDRSRFEIIIYNTSSNQDEDTGRARSLADNFVQVPEDWLSQIFHDKPDIIFYPEIGMDITAVKLASLRLAPLQVASWGHPITTGLPTIDMFFSGELLERKDADNDYRERLVCLPGTGACSVLMSLHPIKPDADAIKFPEDRSITRFLVCQHASKFDPSFDYIYPRIAQTAGKCCFWIVRDAKYPWASNIVEQRIRDAFESEKLDPDKFIRFVDWFPGGTFWWLLDEMDVYLDTPAFSGYTTAWQAIHRGLPVVTCEGKYMRQRLAAGLLRRIGITETIAADANEFISKAAELANEPMKRMALRKCLLQAASLADEDINVVRAFETVLLENYPGN